MLFLPHSLKKLFISIWLFLPLVEGQIQGFTRFGPLTFLSYERDPKKQAYILASIRIACRSDFPLCLDVNRRNQPIKRSHKRQTMGYFTYMCGGDILKATTTTFCASRDLAVIINCSNFSVDRLLDVLSYDSPKLGASHTNGIWSSFKQFYIAIRYRINV